MENHTPSIESLAVHLREFEKRIDDRFDAHREALSLQSKEYERRLDNLNHSHEVVAKIQEQQVGREIYDRDREETNRHLSKLEDFKANTEGRFWGVGAFVVIINIVIGLIIALGIPRFFLK
jgi:hypothetical protein